MMMTMMISSWKFPEFSTGYKLTSVCRIECSTVYLLQKWNTTTYFPTFEKCASFGKQIVSFVVWIDCVCVYVDKIKSKQMKRERVRGEESEGQKGQMKRSHRLNQVIETIIFKCLWLASHAYILQFNSF